MKIVKSQRLGLFTRVLEGGGPPRLVVSASAFFALDAPATEEAPCPLGTEVGMWKLAAEELGPDAAFDVGLPKPRGELLLSARAYPRGGTPRTVCSVRVRLGSVDKTLYVVGDRYFRLGGTTDPEPFTEMPITWANAFGGPGYPQNPLGKGHDSSGDRHPLPNVEDPKRLVSSTGDRPPPAGFGPYDQSWPQRFSKIGTYDESYLEDRYPGYAADFDPGYFNAAPADQQIEGYFRGDEPFTLENLHPDVPVFEGRLPGIRARVFLNFAKADVDLREVPMRADTVHLFPHAQRGIVIFRGELPVAEDDAADVHQIVAAFEALAEPKPLEHYATVLAQRIDPDRGALYALRDRDLLPAGLAKAPPDPSVQETQQLLASEGFVETHLRGRAERELAAAHKARHDEMVAAGLEPPEPPAPLPPQVKAPEDDELPERVTLLEEQLAEAKADGELRFAEMEKLARLECEKDGIDYDKAVLEERAKGGGPPQFSAAAQMAELREQVAKLKGEGMAAPELEAQLDDPAFVARLEKTEAMLRDSYRFFAHYLTPAVRLLGDAAAIARASVVAARDGGEPLAQRDLTGFDLSHLDLRGVDLRLSFLECANLDGADLRGADLSFAVLTRASLEGAKLEGAKLGGANLGGANLAHADLHGETDLTGVVLVKADLSHANLAGAQLRGADLGGATFVETDLRGASAPDLTFLKADLRGLLLGGADLHGCVFIECTLDGIDFTKAVLEGAILVKVSGKGCVFRGAQLTGVQFVSESSFEGASFAGANLTRALLRATNLAGADFSDATLTSADLSESDLTGATFEHAVARTALFIKSNLTRANLKRADLMEALLQRSNLRSANLEGANLFRADLLKANVDTGTIIKGANLKSIRFIQAKKAPHGER